MRMWHRLAIVKYGIIFSTQILATSMDKMDYYAYYVAILVHTNTPKKQSVFVFLNTTTQWEVFRLFKDC